MGEPISAASDTYQLGLLLFELLTGQRAHHLPSRTLVELEKAVCDTEPTRPSALVGMADADPSAAWARRTQPKSLSRRLGGDLDNIVLLALRKEPEKRYASVSQLIDDVERHLDGRPVSARAPTLGYRSGKFLRRHALGVAVAGAFLALLVGYAVTATLQGQTIARERDRVKLEAERATRVSEFLVETFEAADPYQTYGEELTATQLLEAGSKTAYDELQGEPELLSEILLVLGDVSSSLGAHERAERLLTGAYEQVRLVYPEDHPKVARSMRALASSLSETGDSERARELASGALAIYDANYPPDHPERLDALMTVAFAETILGQLDEAIVHLREEVEIRESTGARDAQTARAINDLAGANQRAGRYEESEELHRRALALRRFLFPPEHPDVSESLNNLAVVLRKQHRDAEAEPLYLEALEIRRSVFGPRHSRVANILNNLGVLTARSGRLDESIALHEEALSIRREVWGEDHSNIAMSLHGLGIAYRESGDLRRATEYLTSARAMFIRTLPEGHILPSYSETVLGRVFVASGRYQEAAALLKSALDVRSEKWGDDHNLTIETQLVLGICRAGQGRSEEAMTLIQEGIETAEELGLVVEASILAEAKEVLAQLG